MALRSTRPLTEISTSNFSWWVKAALCVGLNFTTLMCGLSWNLGASTTWNPRGLSRPVEGLLYLYLHVVGKRYIIFVRGHWQYWNSKTFDDITRLNVHVQIHRGELLADELRAVRRFPSPKPTPEEIAKTNIEAAIRSDFRVTHIVAKAERPRAVK